MLSDIKQKHGYLYHLYYAIHILLARMSKMGKELLFSQARELGIATDDFTIWGNSLLIKLLRLLGTAHLSGERVVRTVLALENLLTFVYQWELHSANSIELERINFAQINLNLRKHNIALDKIIGFAAKFNAFGIPIVVSNGKLNVIHLSNFCCQIGTRIKITDALDRRGNIYHGDNSIGFTGAKRCLQIPSLGVNPRPIYNELFDFARTLSVYEAYVINQIAISFICNGADFYQRNQLVSYQIGWNDHVVGFSFYKPPRQDYAYIGYCNRAKRNMLNACYRGKVEHIDAMYKQFCTLQRGCDALHWDNFVAKIVMDPQKLPKILMPNKIQKNDNCVYANIKSLVLANLCMLSGVTDTNYQNLIIITFGLYKRYTEYMRINCLQTVSQRYSVATHDIEKDLLQKIACKILLYYQAKKDRGTLPAYIKEPLRTMTAQIFGADVNAIARVQLSNEREHSQRNRLFSNLLA